MTNFKRWKIITSVHSIVVWFGANVILIFWNFVNKFNAGKFELSAFEFIAHLEFKTTYFITLTFGGGCKTHLCRKMPSHNCTPTIPKIKNTKKHSNKTLPNIGNVSSRSITNIRMPRDKVSVVGLNLNYGQSRLRFKGCYLSVLDLSVIYDGTDSVLIHVVQRLWKITAAKP